MKSNCVIKVQVQPKASNNFVDGCQGDTVRLRVTAPPENGKANAAVIELLATALKINSSRLAIIKGLKSRGKSVGVESLTLEEGGRRLSSAVR